MIFPEIIYRFKLKDSSVGFIKLGEYLIQTVKSIYIYKYQGYTCLTRIWNIRIRKSKNRQNQLLYFKQSSQKSLKFTTCFRQFQLHRKYITWKQNSPKYPDRNVQLLKHFAAKKFKKQMSFTFWIFYIFFLLFCYFKLWWDYLWYAMSYPIIYR